MLDHQCATVNIACNTDNKRVNLWPKFLIKVIQDVSKFQKGANCAIMDGLHCDHTASLYTTKGLNVCPIYTISMSLTKTLKSRFYSMSLKFYLIHYLMSKWIETDTHVTLMIKILGICIPWHVGCVFEPKFSITIRYSTNLKSSLQEWGGILDA